MVQLGSAFAPLPFDAVDVQPPVDPAALRLELVLEALEQLRDSLTNLPQPQVFIDAPDLGAIVSAVNGLKPGADAEQIAAAVVKQISPLSAPTAPEAMHTELLDVLKKLDFRLKGVGNSGSAITPPAGLTVLNNSTNPVPTVITSEVEVKNDIGNPLAVTLASNTPDVTDRAARLLGHVTVDPGSYVSDTFAAKVGQGKARIGGATVTTSAIATNAYFTVENPAGNTRTVYLVGFDCYIDTGSATVNYRTGGTTPNPSVGTLFNPNQGLSAPSSAIIHAGTTAPTGTVTQPIASRLTTGAALKLQQLVILPPGGVFGIVVTGATTGANITANGYLYEE